LCLRLLALLGLGLRIADGRLRLAAAAGLRSRAAGATLSLARRLAGGLRHGGDAETAGDGEGRQRRRETFCPRGVHFARRGCIFISSFLIDLTKYDVVTRPSDRAFPVKLP
jgi:hypothetical protein